MKRSTLIPVAAACAFALAACKPAAAPADDTGSLAPAADVVVVAAPAPAANAVPAAPAPPATSSTSHADLSSFAPAGGKVIETHKADLNGDGMGDALLVIDPPAGPARGPGEPGPGRIVLVALGAADGTFSEAARNESIVGCATCGGLAGDPFAFATAAANTFTVETGGGSRERWTHSYTFKYNAAAKTWLADAVDRKVVDTETEKQVAKTMAAADLHGVTFANFDPALLPEVSLP